MSAKMYTIELIEGSYENITQDELEFIEFGASFEGLLEVYMVDELGYRDIWFVFDDHDLEKEKSLTNESFNYFNKKQIDKIKFMTLVPENFICEPHEPIIKLKFNKIEQTEEEKIASYTEMFREVFDQMDSEGCFNHNESHLKLLNK